MIDIVAHGDKINNSSYMIGPDISVSWLGILLAFAAAMVIGSLWYGPLFGKKWMKLVKLDPETAGSPVTPMLIMAALALVQAFVLAHFIAFVGSFYPSYSEISVGILTGAWAFIGFVAPVLISNTVFAKSSVELLKINLGNQLITLVAIGAILGAVN